MSVLSTNARKQQEEDIERLVKCRLRSEIEARKAVESTMKRAVQEARELKKELVVLRQEKEELRLAARKNAVSAPGSGDKESSRFSKNGASKGIQPGKQGSNKAVELKLRQKIQTLTVRNNELESSTNTLQQQVSELEAQKTALVAQLTADLEEKERETDVLQNELKKTKLVVDETKRKCQKMLKDKREEAQRALQENEQLARCTKTLQGQLALLPQLKKQLEHAKEKRADVVEVWQKKLEQRDQAFLREEEMNKQKLAESADQVAELTEEKQVLQARLKELEIKLSDIDNKHQTQLHREAQRLTELESTSNQLKEKLLAAEAAARDAEQAEIVARKTQEQETRLRQLAEDAADAVEARAEKAERDLAQAQVQLSHLEEALKARGVTLDYLLKQQTPVSIPDRTPSTTRSTNKAVVNKALPGALKGLAKGKTMAKSRLSTSDAHSLSKTNSRRNNNNDED